jgi:hypothetical protein
MPAKYTAEERVAVFWSRVDRDGPVPEYAPHLGPCWLWLGSTTHDGYGKVGWREAGQTHQPLAHVWAYRVWVGPIGDGLELDHLCRTRACVRPSHLEPVTKRVNCYRGESFAAENARKRHCINGHPFDEANTSLSEAGVRRCLMCSRAKTARYRARKRVAW